MARNVCKLSLHSHYVNTYSVLIDLFLPCQKGAGGGKDGSKKKAKGGAGGDSAAKGEVSFIHNF